MRAMIAAVAVLTAVMAAPTWSQTEDASDPLIRACLLSVQIVDLGRKSDVQWNRVHRHVTVTWTGHDGSQRQHDCQFLDGEVRVPELVATATEKGYGPRPNLELAAQNALIWECFQNPPANQFCDTAGLTATN